MKNIMRIARKEPMAYFASPISYVVIAAFMAIMGHFFWLIVPVTGEAFMRGVFANMATVLLYHLPGLAAAPPGGGAAVGHYG